MTLGFAYGDGFVGDFNATTQSTVYVKGGEFIDGSVRFILDQTGMIVRVEKRVAGTWILTHMETDGAPDNWLVDDDLGEFVLDPLGSVVIEGIEGI